MSFVSLSQVSGSAMAALCAVRGSGPLLELGAGRGLLGLAASALLRCPVQAKRDKREPKKIEEVSIHIFMISNYFQLYIYISIYSHYLYH